MFTSTLHTRPVDGGQENEDWVGVTSNLAVVLDGATIRTDTGCLHGLPWYVRSLGAQLVDMAGEPDIALVDAIHTAISTVNDLHADTCDLTHDGTPSAAIGMVRVGADDTEYAVLGDISVILNTESDVRTIVDDRVSKVAVPERRECDRHLLGTDAKMDAILAMKPLELAARNREGGYWIAASEPSAAEHAITGSVPTRELVDFGVCSDGAMRALEMTSLDSPAGVLSVLRHQGPTALVDQVRSSETRDADGARWPRNKAQDDATAVYAALPKRVEPTPIVGPDPAVTAMASRNLMGEFAHR